MSMGVHLAPTLAAKASNNRFLAIFPRRPQQKAEGNAFGFLLGV
jgi:hypothetical protein